MLFNATKTYKDNNSDLKFDFSISPYNMLINVPKGIQNTDSSKSKGDITNDKINKCYFSCILEYYYNIRKE
jgi:hypothetical protein